MQTLILVRWQCAVALSLIVLVGTSVARNVGAAGPVELVELNAENWDLFVPVGKEVDAIYGDLVLRNQHLVAVIGRPVAGRNANMSVKAVGGCLIDLTRRQRPNDQLSAYFPGGATRPFTRLAAAQLEVDGKTVDPFLANGASAGTAWSGRRIALRFTADPVEGRAALSLVYTLADGEEFLSVDSTYHNSSSTPLTEDLVDAIRADRVFEFGTLRSSQLFWAADEWFGQAYGVITPGRQIIRDKLLKITRDGDATAKLAVGDSLSIQRKIFPAESQLALLGLAQRLTGLPVTPVTFVVRDPAGPVVHARLSLRREGSDEEYGAGRTGMNGELPCELPPGKWHVKVEALGRPVLVKNVESPVGQVELGLEPCGYVVAEVTDHAGRPIPCKVAFLAEGQSVDPPRDKDGRFDPRKVSPYFGPDSGEYAVHNLCYTPNGKFRQEIAPGKYDVIVSFGTEYDAVFTKVEVAAGKDSALRTKLTRSVDTKGWVSADFHSHSSPSGDNVASQLGRVLNLICENIEFAPCTEHNRIDSYVPQLERLQATSLLATCTGIEVTGSLLPVNHQNAFPLKQRPRTQDGGGPAPDADPELQIERLALWDGGAEKVVQSNHPNLAQIFGDRDLDGTPDQGFRKMFGFMDVMEVHPPGGIFNGPPTEKSGAKSGRHAIFYWMQLLNRGYRIPGVVNTDAHYNFHGSGWLRNYLRSSTDDPAKIDTMEMVRAAKRGHVIMTNGPFLEVSAVAAATAKSSDGRAATAVLPGDDLVAADGQVVLNVRVQCANWLDVNRVQIFVNGRPVESLNWTRRSHPERFADGVVKFAQQLPVKLTADAHLIVAVAGEGLSLGPVMGPDMGKTMPVAVSNPIFVRFKGEKFTPNGDDLGAPLPEAK